MIILGYIIVEIEPPEQPVGPFIPSVTTIQEIEPPNIDLIDYPRYVTDSDYVMKVLAISDDSGLKSAKYSLNDGESVDLTPIVDPYYNYGATVELVDEWNKIELIIEDNDGDFEMKTYVVYYIPEARQKHKRRQQLIYYATMKRRKRR